LEEADQHLLQRVTAVTRRKFPSKKSGRLLMKTERQNILELNAWKKIVKKQSGSP
jgi:hypothetical protein